MPINNITQTISTLPPAGRRGIDVQTQFVIKQEDFQDHLQGITVTELNTLKDQLNSRIGEINSTTTTMSGYAGTASAGASTATTKAGEASTSAGEALTYRNQAETFKNNASNSATKASQWADNNYNVEVETGRYSAKHWSVVAQNATSGKIDKVPSTNNAIVRFDGTSGAVQNSVVTIGASGEISTPGEISTNTQLVIGSGGDNRRGAIYSDSNWGMLFRAKIDTPILAPFVWMKGDGSELFRHNGTAFTTNITGNAATATTLVTARTINGVSFDGSANISVGLDTQSGAISTSFTLDTTHKNKLLVCNNGITITLPTINTIKSGDLFYIRNEALTPLTLALNGNSINLNTLKVTGGETLIIQSDGGSFYRCISRKSTPIYDFDTNLITPLGYNTVYRAAADLTLIVICSGSYMNGAEIVIGTTASPTRVVSRMGDDINSNTKYATLTAVIPAGLYFKVQGFTAQAFEAIEITAYTHK